MLGEKRTGVRAERGGEHVAARFLRVLEREPVDREEQRGEQPGALVEEPPAREPHGRNRGTEREHRRCPQRGDGARDAVGRPLDERMQDLVALAPGDQRDEAGKIAIDGRPGVRLVLPETAPLQVREPEGKGQARARGDGEPYARVGRRGRTRVGSRSGAATTRSDPVQHRATGTRRPFLWPSCSTRADRPRRGRRAIVRLRRA